MRLKRGIVTTNILWNWSRYVIILATALYITPFILSRLGEVVYGTWILLGSILGYYGLLNFGIDSSVVRYVSKHIAQDNREELQRVIRTSIILFRFLGFIVFLLSALCAVAFSFSDTIFSYIFTLPDHLRYEFSILLVILGTGAAVSFFARVHIGIIRAVERYDLLNIINILTTLGRLIAVVLFMKQSLLALGCIFAVFNILSSLGYILAARQILIKHVREKRHFNRGTFRKLVKYGMFTFVTYLADQFRFHTDAIVIGHFLTMGRITYYNLGYILVSHFRNIIGSFAAPFFPLFSRYEGAKDYQSIRKIFSRASKGSALITALIGGVLLGSGRPFLKLWVGDSIGASNVDLCYTVLLILLLPFALEMVQSISVNILYGISKHYFLSFITTSEGIVNLVLSIILVQKYGIIGVAAGTAIPMIITKIFIQPRYVCKLIGVSTAKYMIECLGAPVLIGMLLGYIQILIYYHISSVSWILLILIAAFTTTLFAIACYLIYFNKDDRLFFSRIREELQ